MKILVFTDLHGDRQAYDTICKKVRKEKPDLLVNCGDFSMFGMDISSLIKSLNFGIKMLTIPGNHESSGEIKELANKFEHVVNIHRKAKRLKELLFLGVGGGGFGELDSLEVSEEKFSKAIKKFKEKYPKGKVVLITHAPPYNTKQDKVYRDHVGARNIRRFIKNNKIDYCFCGHIHERSRTKDKIGKTIIVNPGNKGMMFEI